MYERMSNVSTIAEYSMKHVPILFTDLVMQKDSYLLLSTLPHNIILLSHTQFFITILSFTL